ncbi:MAG: helix-turn-helix domain-containing protein [Oscillospiraceae bacterium]|nr:helix-turn-helix domain-containing protein [Oscillospiraceae bacterium]
MDDEKLKSQIGANIAAHRKRCGMTQAGLAEKLNYSDKAVSKWERGESVPDVITLMNLAERFEIPVTDLLEDPNKIPDDSDVKIQQVVEKHLKRKPSKTIILRLSSLLVWFVALFIYVVVSSFDIANGWLPFFYAIPADAIVRLSLRSAWHDFRWNRVYVSIIVWGVLLSFFVTMSVFFRLCLWRVFLLGIPGQIAIFLWFRMFRPAQEKEESPQEEEDHE